MRNLLFLLIGTVMALPAAELTMFAPAVEFTQVEWLGVNMNGRTSWHAGAEDTATPPNLGGIQKAKVTGLQEIRWQGKFYEIQSVKRLEGGVVEVVFAHGKLHMTRTSDGFYLVDVFAGEAAATTADPAAATVPRFRTTRKATAHDTPER